ncbi:hypothetical protein PIN31115_01771 [Pandoraea iniqua]|uniref:Uncharacterized protein n=1 Tax=Pandoraea iniqua TaxID=2508288 RepID=A0A5E4U4A1_9BURK|nr:hypothetical protein [Pandoraea iniqua]VVD94403.1 hypothetical protein PIN31115_01771 [Pandoraea iniqua]
MLAGAAVFAQVSTAWAQPPQYKSDAELMGAAIASPEGVGQVLGQLVQKCGLYGEATRAHGNAALRAWESRHREYLLEGRRVRAELQATYTDPQARQSFDELLRTQLPMLVERQFTVYARSIDDQTTEAAKADLCDNYFNAVDDRQFDLTVNDPALAAFFDKRIAARNSGTSGAAGASGTSVTGGSSASNGQATATGVASGASTATSPSAGDSPVSK